MIIYDGPSMLNGKPILGILAFRSRNSKTGDMVQLYIIPKRVAPLKASQTGYDESVCGSCPLRHSKGGACYVNIGHGPENVHKAFRNGSYEVNTALVPDRAWRRMRLRLGAYGDPAALPYALVAKLARAFGGHTGYTHQWGGCDQRFKDLVMASTETEGQRLEAKAKGWRTFRVVHDYAEMVAGERVCANESHGVQCVDCMACHGKGNRADIAIEVHGSWGGRLKARPEPEGAMAAG